MNEVQGLLVECRNAGRLGKMNPSNPPICLDLRIDDRDGRHLLQRQASTVVRKMPAKIRQVT